MKTARILVALAALILFAASCTERNFYYENKLSTTIYTIQPKHWTLNEDLVPGTDNYYFCTVDNPDITDEVMDKGAVQAFVYYTYNKAENLSAWTSLPFVYPAEYTDDSNQLIMVAENLRFEWEKGSVTFILQPLDGYTPEQIGNTMSIKVCVSL